MTEDPRHLARASERSRIRALLETTIRLGVVICVGVAVTTAAMRLDDVLGLFDLRADTNAAYTHDQRTHTLPEWGAAGAKVLEAARLWMPEDATYRVVFGREFDGIRSSDFTRHFLPGYLLPRRQTGSDSAEWVFCYGCDDATLGERFEVLSRVDGGPAFGRMLP